MAATDWRAFRDAHRRQDGLCSRDAAGRTGGGHDRRGPRSFATSELDAILEPSPERIVPGCEYVPRCGGCQYQHASPAFQLQMKLDILKETLARAHLPVAERNRQPGRAAVGLSQPHPPACVKRRIALGYRQRGSHNLLPVTHCPIAAPLLEQAIAAVDAHWRRRPLSRACAMKWNSLPTASRTSCSSLSGRSGETATAPARTRPGSVRRATAGGAPCAHRGGALGAAKP